MKKLIYRKVLNDFIIFLVVSTISVGAIVWVFQSVNYLDIIVDDGRDYKIYLGYSFLTLPKILSKIFPFALFFSFYYTLLRLENNNELIIFWSHGLSKLSLLNFFLKFSIILLFIQIIFTTILVPLSQDMARSVLRSSNINFLDSFIKEKKFNDMVRDLTIHAESKMSDGKFENLYIKKKLKDNTFEITYAKFGEVKTIKSNQFLVLYDGKVISGSNYNVTTFNFSQSNINLEEFESNIMKTIKTQENLTTDLIKCYIYLKNNKNEEYIKNQLSNLQNCSNSNLHEILRELYKRLIIPFYLPILILVSLSLLLTSKEDVNYFRNKIIIFIIGFGLIISSETTLRFVNSSLIKNIFLILMPFTIFLIIYLIIIYKINLKHKNI
jgi:lipopolysaccharide export system permease protein